MSNDPRREPDDNEEPTEWSDEETGRRRIVQRLYNEAPEPELPTEEDRINDPLCILRFQLKLQQTTTNHIASLHQDREKNFKRIDSKIVELHGEIGGMSADLMNIKITVERLEGNTRTAMEAALTAVASVEGIRQSMETMEATWTAIFNKFETRVAETFATKEDLAQANRRLDSLEKRFQWIQEALVGKDLLPGKVPQSSPQEVTDDDPSEAAPTPRTTRDEPGDAGDPTQG